ncbi:MAG: hypothetical protein HDS68_02840 [Bacteroidales bacterium]|nr:hypothetical protein [Bacteroidales bacterium]
MDRLLKIMGAMLLALICLPAAGADPTATDYSVTDCLGSAKPYPAPEDPAVYPDSLTPVFVNHVGRHGARFLSSAKTTVDLTSALVHADSAGVLSPLGQELLRLVNYVADISHNRWGALDSLGMAEQRGIASRMFLAYPKLFIGGKVNAISSYAPRCVMSMYEFTHQLARLNNKVEIYTSSGAQNSPLMRPFDVDKAYVEWAKEKPWEESYNMFFETTAPASPARKLFTKADFLTSQEAADLSWTEYKVLVGLPAMGLDIDLEKYFTKEELNSLWACENLGHYLRRTATTLSVEPALIASDLLLNLINTTDQAVAGSMPFNVELRFGHAETLMPLLSLMRLPGCYYMTNYFDTVAMHWKDFDVVPMAANLQIVLFRTGKGDYCVRVDLNEKPVRLIPNSDRVYIPWQEAREYLVRCLPLHLQP